MIIEDLLNLVYSILNLIFKPILIPGFPSDFLSSIEEYFGYLDMARGLIGVFIPINITPYIVIILGILVLREAYPFIMWILRKVPILGIK